MRWIYCHKYSVFLIVVEEPYIHVGAMPIKDKKPPVSSVAGLGLGLPIEDGI
jgi:hypothetical protein